MKHKKLNNVNKIYIKFYVQKLIELNYKYKKYNLLLKGSAIIQSNNLYNKMY